MTDSQTTPDKALEVFRKERRSGDRVFVWFDSRGRIVQLTESRGVNEPPVLPGAVEYTGSPATNELRQSPHTFYRHPSGNLEQRKPVRIELSKRVVSADGQDSLVARVVGAPGRAVKVRIQDQETEIDEEGLKITSENPGMIRVALHEDEIDLVEEHRENSYAVVRDSRRLRDEDPPPGEDSGR